MLRKRLSALLRPRNHHGESHAFTGSGGDRDRTDDPLLAKQVLSQLSYTPGVAKQHRPTGETEGFAERGVASTIRLSAFAAQTPVAAALSRESAGGGPGRI